MAQRALLLAQFADGASAVAGLHWNTDATNTLYTFKPLSRGTIAISSATDALVDPLIDYRTATDPVDMAVYVALFKKNRQVMGAAAMAALGPSETAPFGAAVVTDAQIAAAVRTAINPSNGHACCTAAMLPRLLGGVVDSENRVYGVTGLRVIDISFWPFPVAGAPSATMYGVSEKVCPPRLLFICLSLAN